MSKFWEGKTVVVTGGSGFLGGHVVALLRAGGAAVKVPRRADLDLRDPMSTTAWFARFAPGALVIHLAANVGGIGYNMANGPALFRDNILIGVNAMHAAHLAGAERFVLVGTACSYPKMASVPFRPEFLWDGRPEETNAPYGIAKRALIEMAATYKRSGLMDAISVIPTNLYGPGDNFDPKSSHVIPALIHRMHKARDRGDHVVDVWGSGRATRDFLYVTDAARGIMLAAEKHDAALRPFNLGSGNEITIGRLARIIADTVGFRGQCLWDTSKPDGQPRRALDISEALSLGWKPAVDIERGIRHTWDWVRQNLRAG